MESGMIYALSSLGPADARVQRSYFKKKRTKVSFPELRIWVSCRFQISTMISFLLKMPGMKGGLYKATTKLDFGTMAFLESHALSSSVF